MQNYQSITLDVNNCVEYKYINAKQGDIDSRFLKITLTENGKKIEPSNRCIASFRCLKPDGRICVNKSIINEDGTITVTLTEQVLASAGTVRADISLLDGNTVLSSATFFIMVEVSPASAGSALSSDEFLILVKTTNDAVSAINSIEDALGDVEEVKAFIGYTDSDILGLSVDYENKKFNRLAGAVGLNAGDDFDKFNMYGGMKRCNVLDDGTITAYYGDSDFKEDGSNGQVMVYVPKFYYKVVPVKLDKIAYGSGYHIRKANYYIADTPKKGFKLHPAFVNEQGKEVDYFLYSAYEGSLYRPSDETYFNEAEVKTINENEDDLISSVADTKPVSGQSCNLTRENTEKHCSNRGNGWHCETIKSVSALKFLMMIEFGTLNVQNALSEGIVSFNKGSNNANCCALTGATSDLGNKTGVSALTTFQYYDSETDTTVTQTETASGKTAVSYRGIENPYGNIFKWVEGINIWGDGAMNDGQSYICNNYSFNDTKNNENYEATGFLLPNKDSGYISAFGYGNEKYDWAFIPSESDGTSSLPVGDKAYGNPDINRLNCLICGGSWKTGAGAGVFLFHGGVYFTYKSNTVGCRLIYLPQN